MRGAYQLFEWEMDAHPAFPSTVSHGSLSTETARTSAMGCDASVAGRRMFTRRSKFTFLTGNG